MSNFRGNEDLHRLGKEYLNVSLCKFAVYFLQHSETFDMSNVFLPLTIAELSTLKWFFYTQTVFLAHLLFTVCNTIFQSVIKWLQFVIVCFGWGSDQNIS